MTEGTEVVVLGAGIAGCAAAYYLAREGVRVKVVEREAPASGASGYAVGLLNPLTGTGIPGPLSAFAEAAFKVHKGLWGELEAEAGLDIQARTAPHLQLCFTEDDVRAQQTCMERWAATEGFAAEWLEAGDVLGLEPRISKDVLGAVLLQEVGLVDSRLLTIAMLKAAVGLGAELVNDEVTGLRTEGSRIAGVRLVVGSIDCDAAVVALGPWAGEASRWLGVNVPVGPLKGEIIHLEAPAAPLPYHMAGPGQVVQKADGRVWLAATEEEAGFDLLTTTGARETLLERGARMVPSLLELRVVGHTACLRPVSPDRLPVLGKAPGWENGYLATSAEKKGILIGPAMGRAVADLVVRGETLLPVAPLAPERFAGEGRGVR